MSIIEFNGRYFQHCMMDEVKALRWNGILYMDQKVCLNLEKRPIACCCTHEQKMNFEGFTQNGCYGN